MTTTSTHTHPDTAPKPGRALNITLWVVQILLAALFAFAGINKLLTLQQGVAEGFAMIGFGQWFQYLTGALELAGGIGLLIPRLAGPAALGLAGVMVGAIFAHLLAIPPAGLARRVLHRARADRTGALGAEPARRPAGGLRSSSRDP